MHPLQTSLQSFSIRDADDDDGDAIIALIANVFAEYPGCYLDVDGEMPELRTIATHFRSFGGCFWIAGSTESHPHPHQVVGCVGFKKIQQGTGIELCKLYVAKQMRRQGLGNALCNLVEDAGRMLDAQFVELWSDTRFTDAHRLYERRGYIRGPKTRTLFDISNTVEFYFRLSLRA